MGQQCAGGTRRGVQGCVVTTSWLPHTEWLPHAQTCGPGQRRRVKHVCGDGRPMLVENAGNGVFKAWCHRCHLGGIHTVQQTLAERLAYIQGVQRGDMLASRPGVSADQLGAEYEPRKWPHDARVWLYKAGISDADIRRQRWGYLPEQDRVLLRVVSDGVEYWQARAHPKHGEAPRMPKYLSATPRPHAAYRFGTSGHIVITEDILSAYKMYLAGFTGMPVMGTSLPPEYITHVLSSGGRCVLWMDPDAAGRRAAATHTKALRASGVAVRMVLSERDPKLHFTTEIREYVENAAQSLRQA